MAKYYPKTLPDFYLTKLHRKLLKHAIRLLDHEDFDYCCPAIEHGSDFPESAGIRAEKAYKAQIAAGELTRFIDRAIRGCAYFHNWQSNKGYNRTIQQRRADRIKWLKYILKNTPKAQA